MVKKLNCLRIKERGKEFKVPYYASAAAVCDGNLPLFPTLSNKGKKYLISSSLGIRPFY